MPAVRSEKNGMEPTVENFVNSMPCEILEHIFAFLPLEDRKNVRLTSKLWYDCSTGLSITKNEKFVFRTGFSVQDIAQTLLKSNFLQMNLEFQGLHIDSLPTYTWKSCGRRVHSLEFHDCRWSDKTIKNIILHCVDLTSFKVSTSFCIADHNLGNIFCSPRLLNDLIGKGVKRTKLHTFALIVDDVHLPSSVLKNIFLIYPNIKHFYTGAYSCEDSSFYCLVLHLGKEPILSRLDKCLTKPFKLESLAFNVPTDGRWMRAFIARSEDDQMFRKFETMIIQSTSLKSSLFSFFKSQKCLEVVRLSIADSTEKFCKKLFFHVLENCPNLREFRLRFDPYSVTFTHVELPRFFAAISKLQYLSLSFDVLENAPCEKLPTFNLITARLDHAKMNEEFSITFLKHCPHLKHLEMSYISNQVLQTIIKYLPNLETLILNYVDMLTNDGFVGRDGTQDEGYSIKKLRKLRYLELNGFQHPEFTEKIVHEFQFPCLETLCIITGLFGTLLLEEKAVDLAFNFPVLKSLTIDGILEPYSLEELAKFCKHLKRLHRIDCYDSDLEELYYKDEKLLKNVFEACPSLRYISDSEFSIFSFNPFTKKVLRKTLEHYKFRGSVFDGDFPPTQCNHVYHSF